MDRTIEYQEKFQELETQRSTTDLEEFEEFVRKVEEVNKIVHALNSEDKIQIEEATRTADEWLEKNSTITKSSEKEIIEETIHNPSDTKIKPNKNVSKTIINKKEPEPKKEESLDNLQSEAMSQEAFMKSVEEDAKRRSEDRKKRNKESDALKVEANKAFREQDYERALDLFNKAIDVRKDSCLLYTNRALTLLNLGLYTRALKDTEWALRLNEKSLKARLYMGRAYFEMGEEEESENCLAETRKMFPDQIHVIEEYVSSWKRDEEQS